MIYITSSVAALAVPGNLLAQVLESGTSGGNDGSLRLYQTSHSSDDPSFHLSTSLEDKTASADYNNDEDLLVCKTFIFGWSPFSRC